MSSSRYTLSTYAVFAFLSRIVLKRLTHEQLKLFRLVERSLKTSIKSNADIKFMKLLVSLQLNDNIIIIGAFDGHTGLVGPQKINKNSELFLEFVEKQNLLVRHRNTHGIGNLGIEED